MGDKKIRNPQSAIPSPDLVPGDGVKERQVGRESRGNSRITEQCRARAGQNVKVLYMEDDRGEARLLQKRLEQKGYIVDLAYDGEQGLTMFENDSYDVLVVDQSMPVCSGLEVIYTLSSRSILPPTIMVTGAGDEEIAVEAMKLGSSDYIVKDVEGGYLELLPSVIESVLHQHRLAEEKKKAEEALRASEERFRRMIKENADGIAIVDMNGTVLFMNPAAEALFDCEAQEFLGKVFPFNVMANAMEEIVIPRKGGETAVGEMRAVETEWEGKAAYLASIRDTTEMFKTRKSLELLANLVEDAKHVMIFVISHEGNILAGNALARETFGYTEEEMLSQKMEALFKSERGVGWEKIADLVEQDAQWRGELVGVCKDGEEFPVDMAASRTRDGEIGNGKLICFVRDVRREKEIELMKSEFISMASHEMRTPLTSIKNAVDMVLKRKAGEITEVQERFMSMAERNINRLGDLIDSLLDISRIEAGRMVLNWEETDIQDSIEHVVNTLRPLAKKKSITLEMRVDPKVSPIFADTSRIEEVMINIIGNAIKFTPDHGTVTIEAYHIKERPENMPQDVKGFVEISVKDTGIGIPQECVEHLFEKFYQVAPSLSREKDAGTGLGLAISKTIILAHGGEISCESKEGKGSTFHFALPIIDIEKRLYSGLEDYVSKAMETNAPLSLLIFRIEDFERFVQDYGKKQCGVILEVVKTHIIEMGIKTTDKIHVAPLRGEIMVVMPGTDKPGAQVVEKRVRKNISGKEITIGSAIYRASFVSGIVVFPEDGTSAEELVRFARKSIGNED